MLLEGPPQMMMFVLPFVEREWLNVGWVTTMGVGDSTASIAATATALIGDAAGPPTRRMRPPVTDRVTVARRMFTGSPVDKVAGSRPTVAADGKSITTVSTAVPPKPFLRAW